MLVTDEIVEYVLKSRWSQLAAIFTTLITRFFFYFENFSPFKTRFSNFYLKMYSWFCVHACANLVQPHARARACHVITTPAIVWSHIGLTRLVWSDSWFWRAPPTHTCILASRELSLGRNTTTDLKIAIILFKYFCQNWPVFYDRKRQGKR